jgi:hypothetical protein
MFLFGSSEKGEAGKPLYVSSLQQLWEGLGHSPQDSEGIKYAVQALLFQRRLIYFRVVEEGYSPADYKQGLQLLEQNVIKEKVVAICMPGVGDSNLIKAVTPICYKHQSVLIISEKDLYDFLTEK